MSQSRPSILRSPALVAGLLLVLGVVAYAGSFSGEFLNWDDHRYVAGNPELRETFPSAVGHIFGTFHFSNYNPLQRLTYLVEWSVFGDNALPYRTVNLLLHVLAGFLLYRLLLLWLDQPVAAVAGAVLFVIHPLNVENVAWISERKSLLATVFAFAATWYYLRAEGGEKRALRLALLFFTLGLASKTSIVVLPALFLLLDVSMGRKPAIGRYALFAIPAAIFGGLQMLATGSDGAIETLHGGTAITHGMTIVAAIGRYAIGWLLPAGQAPMHSFAPVVSAGDSRFLLGVIVLAIGVVGAAISFKRERRFFVAILWFPVVLLPTLVVPIPIIYAERYLYLATPFLLAAGSAWLINREGTFRTPARAALAVVSMGLLAATMVYAANWSGSEKLWTRSVKVDPNVAEAWTLLGGAKLVHGDLEGAIPAFEQSLVVEPENSEVEMNLAVALLQLGRRDESEKLTVAVTEREPEVARGWVVLGALRDLEGDERGAMSAFEDGLTACPDDSEILINQANFHLRHDRPKAAKKALEAAVRASPEDGEAWKLLGEVCRLGNLPAEAAQCELMYRRCQQ